MLFSDGDMAKNVFSGETCDGIRPARSVEAIEHSSFVGSSACFSLCKHDKAASRF